MSAGEIDNYGLGEKSRRFDLEEMGECIGGAIRGSDGEG